ncbi:sulfatase-like hydrolase/transferase [Labilibacter marinus]|uniref:sulfatase-like hydrolase/transferase n=1 Tax=Labilibacter marinus TaxID=1477105 RepID=UPI0008327C62|nr:sulfatase-like hydrolase/transferase [Labilibacter marinus]
MRKVNHLLLLLACIFITSSAWAKKKPNVIILFADDISARELPIYGSSVWSPPEGGNTSDPNYRAQTPVLDKMANEGVWMKTAWCATVCSPSRAMMMTGRYAHLHKWWLNGDLGTEYSPTGKKTRPWPLYASSPLQLGHVAQKAGYATYWAGKTQMKNSDHTKFGFDEGVFTPGAEGSGDNPNTDYEVIYKKVDGKKVLFNIDEQKAGGRFPLKSYFWKPSVQLMNHPESKEQFEWWPNTPESKKNFGDHSYAPDIELDFVFDFIDRKHDEKKPFFIYHTSHLGHDSFNWHIPASKAKWPGTPKVEWEDGKYTRTEPKVTGDKGVYDLHGTITEPGIHHHINYLDYQVWCYMEKLKAMGEEDNTIFIFCADNGTSGYGKKSPDCQKGCHVPLMIYAPGFNFTKKGAQDALVNMSDILPTVAEVMGYQFPTDYEINGVSLMPYLTTKTQEHRDWIYAYHSNKQLIRGSKVLKDGRGKWYDVSNEVDDLISFPVIKDWSTVSEAHREERKKMEAILPQFDVHDKEHGEPAR